MKDWHKKAAEGKRRYAKYKHQLSRTQKLNLASRPDKWPVSWSMFGYDDFYWLSKEREKHDSDTLLLGCKCILCGVFAGSKGKRKKQK